MSSGTVTPFHFKTWYLLLLSLTASAFASAQDSSRTFRDVIRGAVTSDRGTAVVGAQVIVTRAPDRLFLRDSTDEHGMYEIVFEQGTGDYLVHVSTPGMETFRKRITRVGADSVFVVNVTLKRGGTPELAAVRVNARRVQPKPGPEFGNLPGPGAAERVADGVTGAVPPDLAGNLAAIAGTVPGVTVTSRGVSVAGLATAQNSTTLNGMAFSGADVPRDALTTVRVTTSTYDPARGSFGGLQQDVELVSGVAASTRRAHLTIDAPVLQYTDPISEKLGQKFTNLQADFGAADRMYHDKLDYNVGIHVGRRAAEVVSLASAPGDVLEHVAVAPDSVERLLTAISALGVPVSASHRASTRMTENASFLGQLGSAPYNWVTYKDANTVWQFLGYANTSHTSSIGVTPTTAPGYSGAGARQQLAVQGHLSTHVKGDYLVEGRSGFSFVHDYSTPDLTMPGGSVLVASRLGGDSIGVTQLYFGGNGTLASDVKEWTWETSAEMKFYPLTHPTHRVKITANSRFDGIREDFTGNTLGSFTFNSLADVASNTPASFTRTLVAPIRSASGWNGFLAIGDWWHKSDNLQLLYGVRLEANRFLHVPADNPAVESAFGVRTDHLPNTVAASPRLGFTWVLRGSGGGAVENAMGHFNRAPIGYLRGGIGEFRGFLSPALVSSASARTGLPDGEQMLTCLGLATPTPDWIGYRSDPASVPGQCTASSTQPVFSDAVPNVELFDRGYTAPRSWRANLAYASMFKGISYQLGGVYSLNLNQPGRTDLNFSNVQRFVTSDEGRPVFVNPTSIVPNSGAMATNDARVTSSFGHVFDDVSTLRSVSRQATIIIMPELDRLKHWFGSVSYTIADNRARVSGFDGAISGLTPGSTFDSPVTRDWARGDFDVRHQIVVQGGVMKKPFAITLFGRLQSGFPFSPRVGGDVNGDGLANDLAFIFDPAVASDTSLAAATRSLLASSQSNVRDCLVRQLGHAAGRNSCEGPWTVALNAQITYSGTLPFTDRKGSVALALVNPLGGLDQLVHGSSNLHGWGTSALSDPVLYNVRGFDPAANRFLYEVNPRFGDTRPSATTLRAPFRVTVDFSVNLGAPPQLQFLNRWMRPGRHGYPGPRLSATAIKKSYDRVTPDPFDVILAESDSLLLSQTQFQMLLKAQDPYLAKRDSIFNSLATYLAEQGDEFSTTDALQHQREALDAVWELGHGDIRRALPTILNRIQLRMLPYPADVLYATPDDVKGMKVIEP